MDEKLISLFKQIRKLDIEANNFLDTVPACLRDSIFENPYSWAKEKMIDVLINTVLTKVQVEELYWFLYEFKPKDTPQIFFGSEDKRISITLKSDNDFYDYLRDYC